MKPIIAVVGPTASGKTALAVALAERLKTEIISADSMQVYRGMAIGTGAPTPEEQARARHHFVGMLDPFEQFTAGTFGRQARVAAAMLNASGKPAIVAGGSGLYVRAFIDGLFPGPGKDESIRARLHAEAEFAGAAALYERLQAVDPAYAEIILPGDLRRIVRALEVFEITGQPFSKLHQEHREAEPPLDALLVGLDWPRDKLYARIDARVDAMLEAGFIDEVRLLMEQGYTERLMQLRTLGYREFAAHLLGRQTYEEARAAMQQNTRRYAKRQLTWWRGDSRIHWLPQSADTTPEQRADSIVALAGM